jgi:hypothetical protein
LHFISPFWVMGMAFYVLVVLPIGAQLDRIEDKVDRATKRD